MPLNTGTVLINRYRVAKLLGQGGFGAVYRAWDVRLNKAVALKENLDTSPEAQRQFEHEAQILSALSHPNLPRVTDHSLVPGMGQYLVMDFVEGEDLQERLDKAGGPLPAAPVLTWIEQVCDVLTYMHTRVPPIIHRDIKPANIKITPEGRAVLVDFGISKVYHPTVKTTLGARAVTPPYSPPEQYGQGKTDARTDVYALGATMYALLTGQEPPESVQRLGDDDLPPVHQLNPRLSPAVGQAIGRAMALNPSRRFQTMAEFQAALTAVPVYQSVSPSSPTAQMVRPLTAAPASVSSSLARPSVSSKQNNAVILVVIILLLVCCCCAAGGLYWLWNNGDNLVRELGSSWNMGLPIPVAWVDSGGKTGAYLSLGS